MPKNEELQDKIADLLEGLDERGFNKWGRADVVIEHLAAAWDDGATAGVALAVEDEPLVNPFRA